MSLVERTFFEAFDKNTGEKWGFSSSFLSELPLRGLAEVLCNFYFSPESRKTLGGFVKEAKKRERGE